MFEVSFAVIGREVLAAIVPKKQATYRHHESLLCVTLPSLSQNYLQPDSSQDCIIHNKVMDSTSGGDFEDIGYVSAQPEGGKTPADRIDYVPEVFSAQGFCTNNFVVGTVVADNKMTTAVLAFVALFAASETALVKMFRMTVLAIH
jgi:hypothetical protein